MTGSETSETLPSCSAMRPNSEYHASLARRAIALTMLAALPLANVGALAQDQQPNVTSNRYVINQTFDGRAYHKDNNIWGYSKRFADTFGMPEEWIHESLTGIEAAAFRIESTSYQMCGFAGKPETCQVSYRCITDIYVDEAKSPLPWATDQASGWSADYNSTRWLRTNAESAVRGQVPTGVIPNRFILGMMTLHPFADPVTRKEVGFYHNGANPRSGDESFNNFVQVIGFRRNAIDGLTLIALGYTCLGRNREKSDVTFRLESRKEVVRGVSSTDKTYFEFCLPDRFERRIDVVLSERNARNRDFYRSLLGASPDRLE